MKLRELISNLKPEERAVLLDAFESQICCYIEYEPGKFVGVHTVGNPNLIPTEQQGAWACGTLSSG